ncbi:hypothetical protein F5B21DRAFT_525237 [Xylaria acuta]|nr:hypothetical protein F5B21DRAFT_525237 [Xylaria acuta]
MPPLSLSPALLQWQHELEAVSKAHQSAAAVRHSSYIERLPAELRFLVIENLPAGDLRSIINLALTGPVYYHFVSENEADLAEKIVVSIVGRDVMPFAATLYELEGLGDKLPRVIFKGKRGYPDEESWGLMLEILDRHSGRHNRHNWHTQSRITKFPVAAAYLEFNAPVEYWAKKVASRALRKAYAMVPRQRWRDDPKSKPGLKPKPTATEMRRFCKALYIYQIQSTAFPWSYAAKYMEPIGTSYFCAFQRFWYAIAPWELEQVRQVEILLGCALTSYFADPVEELGPVMDLFLIEQGLTRLRALDVMAHWRVGKAKFAEQWDLAATRHGCSLRLPVTPWEFTLMEFDFDENGNTNLHAGEIFKKYPEGDDGQKFWWYYAWLMVCPPDTMKHRYNLTSACWYCSYMLGYAFWDFDRLRKLTREECPSLDDLLESTRGVCASMDDIFTECSNNFIPSVPVDHECSCMTGRGRRPWYM